MKTVICLAIIGVTAAIMAPPTLSPPLEHLPSAINDTDYYTRGTNADQKIALGRVLFFDKILSGNQNISCSTCHHPSFGTSDGLSLGLGEGATGLGPNRLAGTTIETAAYERVPRNSPALFNLGAKEFRTMFHDGRVEVDTVGYYASGFISPAKWKLPAGLENVLAAQAMFPVTSPTEMACQKGENPVADAVSLNNAAGRDGVWELLARRLQQNAEYVEMFRAAFPERIKIAKDITFVDVANAIAAFETTAFRADQSPFDEYLRGTEDALSPSAERGANLFYGNAGCAGCHAGPFQTDHQFYAIAMPQLGPGKSDGSDAGYWSHSGEKAFLEDYGRGRVTVRPEDRFKFRTPTLRNVELTGPWGHAGSYQRLEDVVRHHLDPVGFLEAYQPDQANLPRLERVLETSASGSRWHAEWLSHTRLAGFLMRDHWVQRTPALRQRIAEANELPVLSLTNRDVADLVSFLESLTDPRSRNLDSIVPKRVPSGLAVEQ